jgi:hypothetical protein
MGNSALMLYLGLSWVEFDQLAAALPAARLEVYRTLDEVSPNLEQLATKLNRPPEADMESDCELEAASRRAFGRLEEAVRVNEEFRRARSNSSLRARQGHQRHSTDSPFATGDLVIRARIPRPKEADEWYGTEGK